MAVRGWRTRYRGILAEFGYSERRDAEAAALLDSVLPPGGAKGRVAAMVRGAPVMVVGAGPSLGRAIPAIRGARGTKIAAGSSVRALVEAGIVPDVVVTDLDGDLGALGRLAGRSVFVVHAHGDNMGRLWMAGRLGACMGTAQSGPRGRVEDYGGFTDGDRAVFLAHHFGASRIVLLGMDFGGGVGRLSDTPGPERREKARKLRRGGQLLEWLATVSGSEMYTTSGRLAGFERVGYGDLAGLLE